ncbi:Uncharacterised protein [Clostridioides difficile]|nr:Uncharacterised protein [Clostridioides difficile]SJP01312.1 Uncharacterised protein [Clostridioides difficile]SJP09343.1 Uncharacterised protein [Clostridioides difficile]SJR14397.1 Uncharacterised protein [Clostridioides difficile]SJR37465.1 Uncharacterised protein [Clostridioides difficile]
MRDELKRLIDLLDDGFVSIVYSFVSVFFRR